MEKEITIIEYQEDYAMAVKEYIKSIAKKEFEYDDWEKYFNKMKSDEYKTDGNGFWIAFNKKDEIVGTIAAERRTTDIVYLCNLYIRKDYRRTGIATELYNTFLDFAHKQKYTIITLKTVFKFTDAVQFYEKLGFVKYGQDEESYFYRKDLD